MAYTFTFGNATRIIGSDMHQDANTYSPIQGITLHYFYNSGTFTYDTVTVTSSYSDYGEGYAAVQYC